MTPRNDQSPGGHDGRGVGTAVVLAGIIGLAFVAYAVYGWFASVPRFLLDELYYLEAGTSLASGDGLRFRDEPWGYGPVLPAVIAVVVRLTASQETTYDVMKLIGSAAYAGALLPVYLLSRRLLRFRSALLVVVLTAILPSTTYVSLVMTECLSFLLVSWVLYLMVVTLERPRLAAQLGLIALLGVAIGLRTQFVALAVAWPLAVLLASALAGPVRPRALLREWWPTATASVIGLLALLGILTTGRTESLLGAYDVLTEPSSLPDLLRAGLHQLADITLTLTLVTVVAAVIMVGRWWRDARSGDVRRRSFVAVFVAADVLLVAAVSIFASSEYAVGSLHDRNLFYVFPLWLVLLAGWLDEGLPRPRRPLVVGTALALVLLAALPFDEIAAEDWLGQHEAPATEVWGVVGRVIEPLAAPMLLFGVGCALAVAFLPRRWRVVLPAIVAGLLLVNLAGAWRSAFIDPTANGAAPRGSRDWVDSAIGDDRRAILLVTGRPCDELEARSGMMTLFFNRSVVDSVGIGAEGVARGLIASVDPSGVVRLPSGAVLVSRYVVTSPSVAPVGRRLATGSPAGLVLWETPGRVRLAPGTSAGCPAPAP